MGSERGEKLRKGVKGHVQHLGGEDKKTRMEDRWETNGLGKKMMLTDLVSVSDC